MCPRIINPYWYKCIIIWCHDFYTSTWVFNVILTLSFWRSFTFYNDVIYNKIRWCKICPNLLWIMRPNVVALVGYMSGLRFSCTFSFTFCWISPIASMQPTRIVWLDCEHHKILKSSQKSFEHWSWNPFWILW